MIHDYQDAVHQAVTSLEATGIPRPKSTANWVGYDVPGTGQLVNGGKYYIHGFGCAVERAKKHADAQIRWGLIDAFFAIDPDSAVYRSLPLIEDKDELVVKVVIRGFSSRGISDPRVVAGYISALRNYDGLFDEPASSAVDALANLGSDAKAAVPALEELIKDPGISEILRENANAALTRIR